MTKISKVSIKFLDRRFQVRNMVGKVLGIDRGALNALCLQWTEQQVEGMLPLTNPQELEAAAIEIVPVAMLPDRFKAKILPPKPQPPEPAELPPKVAETLEDGMDT